MGSYSSTQNKRHPARDGVYSEDTIIKRIKDIINGDRRPEGTWLPALLKTASIGYGYGVRLRAAAYRRGILPIRRLSCKVLSIGNLTLGGTGKTPFTMTLAMILADRGMKVAVVSRGYKGRFEHKGGIVSDGHRILMGPADAGDEPCLLARQLLDRDIPVLIGADRFQTGSLAVRTFNPDVIVLDDGFQHIRLFRDIDVVLMDGRKPFGNGCVFPRGMLREPISALGRADAIVVTRSDRIDLEARDRLKTSISGPAAGTPVFFTQHQPYVAALRHRTPPVLPAAGLRQLRGKKVFGFSGIARNEEFSRTLIQCGCQLVGSRFFNDHHEYGADDVAALLNAARQTEADFMATTEKDYVRLGEAFEPGMNLVVIGVRIGFEDEGQRLADFIDSRLRSSTDAQ